MAIALATATAASPLTLAGAIARAQAAAGIAVPRATVRTTAFPATGLTTSVSAAPEEGRRGAVTESEELTFRVRPGAAIAGEFAAARARAAQAAASARETQRALAGDVIAAFFAVAGDQVHVAGAQATLHLSDRSVFAALSRYRVGTAPLVDVERARMARDEARADLAAARESLAGDVSSLNRLIGGALVDATGVALPGPPVTLPAQETVTQYVLSADPAVASARFALQFARAQALAMRGDLLPSLSLGAGVGRSVTSTGGVIGPAADVSLGIPLGGGAAHADIAANDAAIRAAQGALAQVRLQAVQRALRTLTQAQGERARIPDLERAYAHSQRVADAEVQGYTAGAVSSADAIAAQLQLAAARSALDTARVAAAQYGAALQLAMGDYDR